MNNRLNSEELCENTDNTEPTRYFVAKGATTISKESTLKQVETGEAQKGQDMVSSMGRPIAAKICKKCGMCKLFSDYYKGHAICKICFNKKIKERPKSEKRRLAHNKANVKYRKEHKDKDLASKKAYKKTEKGKLSERRYYKSKMKRIPEKMRARKLINTHIERGKLFRLSYCQNCKNKTKTEAHHKDYKKPLDVIFLCHKCHRLLHILANTD